MEVLQDKSPGKQQEGRAPPEPERIYLLDNPAGKLGPKNRQTFYRVIRKVLSTPENRFQNYISGPVYFQ